jgi:NAD(P)H-hydrate epimerase
MDLSKKHHLYIILKGAYTCISTPQGKCYFNSTGNPGMAKGGSGDVLTGMVASFLAQGYHQEEASLLSVYLHGLSADIAVKKQSEQSLLATDIISTIGDAFREISAPAT